MNDSGDSLSSPKVLIVDDTRASAVMLQRLIMAYWKYPVEVVFDGKAACTVAETYQPDVVLLDIGLPGMDGYQVAKQLRRNGDFHKTLVVALTGYDSDSDRERSNEAGMDLHLVKPVGIEDLQQVFDRWKGCHLKS